MLPGRMVCTKDSSPKPARQAPRWVPQIPIPYRGNGPLTVYVFVLLNSNLLSLVDLRLSVCL